MITERVDDIPLLLAEFEKSQLASLLSEHLPDHGNWQGADSGTVATIFLTYVLSCADHRTSHVEQWVRERIHTLRACTNLESLTPLDLTDDRLGIILDKYSDDDRWRDFELAHNKRLIQVYDLDLANNPVRLDAMITQSHRQVGGDFQMGHSKQHRADLPQLKTMLATVDPFAVPLCSLTVAGNEADDVLYLPVIEELHNSLSLSQQLFVGDSKMGSMGNRAGIHRLGHYYLSPLSKVQCSTTQIAAYVKEQPEELQFLRSESKDGQPIILAKAFETSQTLHDPHSDLTWSERRLVVHSPAYAKSQATKLDQKMRKAQQQLDLLLEPKQGRPYPKTAQEAEQRVEQILKTNQVKGLIDVQIHQINTSKHIRAYGANPARIVVNTTFKLDYHTNEAAVQSRLGLLGWRVYACNAPQDKLTTLDAVKCYRNEYRIEHKFDELLNRVTALMPVYLTKPNRIKALIRLLLVALKYVSLFEMQVRTKLAYTQQELKELYPGNPGRATNKPTAKMMLKAFQYLTLVIIPVADQVVVKLTPLKPIQQKILDLLDLDHNIYLNLQQIMFLPHHFSET